MSNEEKKDGLWYELSHEARVRLVTLGGLFHKQKALAALLGTTGGTIAGFRDTYKIPMPYEKLPRSGSRFHEFSELLASFVPSAEPVIPFDENPQKDLEAGYFLNNLIIKKMEEERTIPRWGKCSWPTVPSHGGEPVRYLCEKDGSPLCDGHQTELGKKTLILHLTSPYPPRRVVSS